MILKRNGLVNTFSNAYDSIFLAFPYTQHHLPIE